MRAVSCRLRRDGKQNIPASGNFFYLLLHNTQFGRVYFVIGGIYRKQRSSYFPEVRGGVIVPGRVELVDEVVCIRGFYKILFSIVQDLFGLLAGGGPFLQLQGTAGHKEKGRV